MPIPASSPALRCLATTSWIAVAHFVNHLVASARDLRAGSDFFQYLAVAIHRGNAQVGAAQINSDGQCRHLGL